MRVLVACEFSGRVRDAFIARGHEAWSCDMLPTERPGPHYRGDVLDLLTGKRGHNPGSWDLLIAHPPCTYLANSGVRWLYGGKGKVPDETRWRLMLDAGDFFAALLNSPIERIAVENPIMHRHGKFAIATALHDRHRSLDDFDIQTIQPYQFGTPETKATQLWLRNLPPLVPTNIVDGRTPRVHFASPGPDRWKERSRTDLNIAAAMAEQWGDLT